MKANLNFKNLMTKLKTTDFFVVCKESRIEKNTSFYGCFYIGPFDDSLSQTLANDLRRTLLSELTGLAITSIEIEGVLHKFSNIPGMKESVLDLISNFQNIVLKKTTISEIKQTAPILKKGRATQSCPQWETSKTKKTYTGFLNVHGPRVIKASDLKLPSGLMCVDPNQYIATLAQDGFLNLKFNINEGKNFIKQKPYNLEVNILKKRNILMQDLKLRYLNTKTNKNLGAAAWNDPAFKQSISNTLPLDAVFMPVTKMNCIVEENKLFTDFSTDLENNLCEVASTNFQKLDKKFFVGCKIAGTEKATPAADAKSIDFLGAATITEESQLLPNLEQNFNFADFFLNYSRAAAWNKLQTCFVPPQTKYKLIPWEYNTLYFDRPEAGLAPKNPLLSFWPTDTIIGQSEPPPINKKEQIKSWQPYEPLAAKSVFYKNLNNSRNGDAKYLFSQLLKKNLKDDEAAAAQQQETTFNQIKIFLALNKRHGEKKTAATQQTLIKYKEVLKKSQQKKQIFKIKYEKLQNNILLEYSKTLKLKPLRKKTHVIVEIWTNGSMHPREALYLSFSFLANIFLKLQTCFGPSPFRVLNMGSPTQSSVFKNSTGKILIPSKNKYVQAGLLRAQIKKRPFFNMGAGLTQPQLQNLQDVKQKNEKDLCFQPVDCSQSSMISLKAPIGVLAISLRVYTALKKEGIFTIEDLLKYTKKDLLKIKNFGVKSLFELETQLSNLGYSF